MPYHIVEYHYHYLTCHIHPLINTVPGWPCFISFRCLLSGNTIHWNVSTHQLQSSISESCAIKRYTNILIYLKTENLWYKHTPVTLSSLFSSEHFNTHPEFTKQTFQYNTLKKRVLSHASLDSLEGECCFPVVQWQSWGCSSVQSVFQYFPHNPDVLCYVTSGRLSQHV